MEALLDYERVWWLRAQMEAAADQLDPVHQGRHWLADADVPASAFGNTTGGPACSSVWQQVLEAATGASASMRRTLRADADRLDQVIATFQSTDHESADEIAAVASRLTVISAHLHSSDDTLNPFDREPGRVWDDYLRAGQHDRLVDYAAGRPGAVAVGVDANVSIDRDGDGTLAEYPDDLPLSPRAVERFPAEGFDNIGDFSDGEPGVGTSSAGASIDYIWGRGVSAGPTGADYVDGGPSDHDGQVAEYALARW